MSPGVSGSCGGRASVSSGECRHEITQPAEQLGSHHRPRCGGGALAGRPSRKAGCWSCDVVVGDNNERGMYYECLVNLGVMSNNVD